MTSYNPQDLYEIFTEALRVPASHRDRWLAQRCGGDEVLLNEVQALLQQNQQYDETSDDDSPEDETRSEC